MLKFRKPASASITRIDSRYEVTFFSKSEKLLYMERFNTKEKAENEVSKKLGIHLDCIGGSCGLWYYTPANSQCRLGVC